VGIGALDDNARDVPHLSGTHDGNFIVRPPGDALNEAAKTFYGLLGSFGHFLRHRLFGGFIRPADIVRGHREIIVRRRRDARPGRAERKVDARARVAARQDCARDRQLDNEDMAAIVIVAPHPQFATRRHELDAGSNKPLLLAVRAEDDRISTPRNLRLHVAPSRLRRDYRAGSTRE
jgi:hypothetical protein